MKKNSNYTIGNRTCNLPACSAVPQPTAPPRAHNRLSILMLFFTNWDEFKIPLAAQIPLFSFATLPNKHFHFLTAVNSATSNCDLSAFLNQYFDSCCLRLCPQYATNAPWVICNFLGPLSDMPHT